MVGKRIGFGKEALTPHSLTPVSYTHLDVYKRQAPAPQSMARGAAGATDGGVAGGAGIEGFPGVANESSRAPHGRAPGALPRDALARCDQ